MIMTEMEWFQWNGKLAAELAALLYKQGRTSESESLVAESISRLGPSESDRDLSLFLCELLESHANHGSSNGFDETFERLSELVRESNSIYVKRQSYKAMVRGLCEMRRPSQAEALLTSKSLEGNVSMFELRCVMQGYGRLGMLSDMERVFLMMEKKMKGQSLDTVSFNMMLFSYAAHNAIGKMMECVRRMTELGVPLSLRTCNTVFNSCPSLTRAIGMDESQSPVSVTELEMELTEEERALVGDLGQRVLEVEGVMTWGTVEWKLDLHGMHLSTAYIVILEWLRAMKRILRSDRAGRVDVTVVCGLGNHSGVRGESPVRSLVKKMITRIGIPMRVDRKNKGCFVAKGKVMEQWLKNL